MPFKHLVIGRTDVDLEIYSSLIESFYDAALQPDGWTDVAKRVARAFDTESCSVFSLNFAAQTAKLLGITENFNAKAIWEYHADFHTTDLVALRMAQSGPARAILSSDVVTEEEFRESEFNIDFAKPQRIGCYWAVGSVFTVSGNVKGAMSIHRPRAATPFDEQDRRGVAMLLPHLSRAMLMQWRLAGLTQGNQILVDTLEKLPAGMIAVDAQARVLFANPTAERLLRAGLGLTCRGGCLGATDSAKAGELRRLIQQAGLASRGRLSEAGGVLALPRPAGRPLSLLICPLRAHALSFGPSPPAALVIFGDPDTRSSTSTQALIKLYGLTPAEARLMAALVDGARLEDYADRQRISLNTARTQLKQVLAKTGLGRQADLIREALINPALRAANLIPKDR